MSEPQIFPEDWTTALVLVAHPDDPEYGMAAAVARWTSEGRTVAYGLATSGEEGIEGMSPGTAGPVREEEQRRSAAVVGVDEVRFWGYPDSQLRNTPELRESIRKSIARYAPDIVITLWGGPDWGNGIANQSDHMEFTRAVAEAGAEAGVRLFQTCPDPTLIVDVTGFTERAVESLAEHRQYLSVLDPQTPVIEQARAQVASACLPRGEYRHTVGFRDLA
ncbi:GlcNAc-PI de-N-acetylase [Tsukamurella pulmonis]|uniref:PIG-L deacetylase family protein n=1 Tax=Tsukamurella pulmonis TaxID=47312 RepID=UPI000796FF89|nr:PIG-L family deacetylase [Tsukamurella pulmonis]KXO87925.1 GlcNAc-PI de-N-acetylase [Tsukamurella pulmonis]KXP12086.1 GlcNAc-PI de-N-acetylase [Tsukamurella pulmonis]BDD82416.1 GlcNAc-PI de-N-acetylase [Tsukamurella pulmonis]